MRKKKYLGLILILGIILYYTYQNGYIGKNSINELISKPIINPYNGIYSYDKSKIENPKILKSVEIESKNGYSPLTLSIEGSGASLLGYQFDSKIRNRFFKVCLSDENIILNNGELGMKNSDYCKIPKKNEFNLKLKSISENLLYCENCEKEEFPSYWRKK